MAEKRQCTATSKRTGARCTRPPRLGATVCHQHGGAAPQVRAAAGRRLVVADAAKTVSALGGWAPVTDPLAALADVAGEVTAVKDYLRGLVEEIAERERAAGNGAVATVVGNLTGVERVRMPDDKGAEQMNAKFTAYMQMLGTCVSTLATIAKLNIDERMAAIDEARAEMIKEALRRALADAGLAGQAQTSALATFSRHLRVVAGGKVAA